MPRLPVPQKFRSLLVLLLILPFALAACAPRHPLGIPDEQWQTLSTEQRLQAHDKQATLDRAEDERRAADARAREAEAMRQRAELETRRRSVRYGERVQCVLGDAQARLGGKWRDIEPVALDLVQDMTIPFPLSEPSGHTVRRQTPAYARFDGQTIFLCQGDGDDRGDSGSCVRLLGTHADYRRGIDQRIDSANFLRGRLRCDLVPTPGIPGPGYRK